MRRGGRVGERGLVRGCALLLVLAAVVVAAGGVVLVKALATPSLGPDPQGTAHGDTELAIAAAEAREVGAAFLTLREHAVAVLSERDLTVLVRARNPRPDQFRDPEARIRSGLVVIDARTDLGPFTVTAVGHVSLALSTDADGAPDVAATVSGIDAGTLSLPAFVRDAIEQRISGSVALNGLLASTPFAPIRALLDCVAVHPDGVALGFHAPTAARDPSGC